MADRYLRIVLTIIAVELGWLGLKDAVSTPASAQARRYPRTSDLTSRTASDGGSFANSPTAR